jgi:glycosyltransferase involved in cell wall biosynthesis
MGGKRRPDEYIKKEITASLNKNKILVFIGGAYVSGLEVVTLHLIGELKRQGHCVRCIVNGWNDGMIIKELQKIEVPFDEAKLGWLYLTKPRWTIDSLVHLPGAYLKCRKILREFDPDIVHFCNYASVILLAPLLKNKACVYNLQEPHEPNGKNLFIYRLLNRRIRIFTAVSRYIEQVLLDLRIPKDKIRLIYNGVPVVECPPGRTPADIFVFGIVGQVVPWKGHTTLVDAVHLLKAPAAPRFLVKVFGNDKTEYAAALRNHIRETGTEAWFSWEGFVREQDSIYSQVDAVIVPSLSGEPCSLTILESMMRGKALIVSDRGGNPELIEDKKTGLIFKADNPAQLAGCISLLLERAPSTLPMGEKAHEKALDSFTEYKMAAAYTAIYADMAN